MARVKRVKEPGFLKLKIELLGVAAIRFPGVSTPHRPERAFEILKRGAARLHSRKVGEGC